MYIHTYIVLFSIYIYIYTIMRAEGMLISKKIEDTHREKLHYCLPYLRQKQKRSYIPEYRSYKPALL
jgi:hypothetical protein